jgi:hypothetical protein
MIADLKAWMSTDVMCKGGTKTMRRGQSVLEYAILISVLCAVFITMFVYTKNAVRARLLVTQDRLNEADR